MAHTSLQAGARPGQMTAVMRAVAVSGPKVLRIGLVAGGRVTEERIIKERVDVTVGPSERSMFVLSTDHIRSSHKLFELVGDGYVLNFLDGMSGRVALPTGVSDLEVLKGQSRRGPSGSYQVRLTEDSRGKVTIGDTTFLFQFVAPPPVQPRPQLPVAVTRGASGIDWRTTIIAEFDFFGYFMAIGAMYSDWLDPVIDEQVSLASLIDTIDRLPPPPPAEEKPPEPEDSDEKAEAAEEKPKAQAQQSESSKIPDQPGGKLNEAQAAALSNELEQLSMMTLGALGAAGPATAGVLQGGEVPTGALDAAAASGAGVGVGGDLKLGGRGGPVQPGASQGLGSIGSTGKGTSGSGTATEVKGPVGNASVSSSVSVGSVSNAASVVAAMRAGFRRCYQRGLEQNPDISGSIRLSISVGPGGEVSNVTGGATGSIPGSVVDCVKGRARAAQFAPPDGGSAVVMVPVSFVKQ